MCSVKTSRPIIVRVCITLGEIPSTNDTCILAESAAKCVVVPGNPGIDNGNRLSTSVKAVVVEDVFCASGLMSIGQRELHWFGDLFQIGLHLQSKVGHDRIDTEDDSRLESFKFGSPAVCRFVTRRHGFLTQRADLSPRHASGNCKSKLRSDIVDLPIIFGSENARSIWRGSFNDFPEVLRGDSELGLLATRELPMFAITFG